MTAHFVLVSSPGVGPTAHWSQLATAQLAAELQGRGREVTCIVAEAAAGSALPLPQGVERKALALRTGPLLAPVATVSHHIELERALSAVLRRPGDHTVVHTGLGARGSPNVPWLAERLGAEAFVIARAAEVVCHRGDLVDRDGRPCNEFLDAVRCRRCCRTSWWSRGAASDFQNRADLLVASLLVASAVFVPGDDDVRRLVEFGLPPRLLVVESAIAAIAARLSP